MSRKQEVIHDDTIKFAYHNDSSSSSVAMNQKIQESNTGNSLEKISGLHNRSNHLYKYAN